MTLLSLKRRFTQRGLVARNRPLRFITGSTASAGACNVLASGTDLADTTAAASCWSRYNTTMDAISTASGMNVRNLKDPWGRPYFIDENEQEGGPCGSRDQIGAYYMPHQQGNWNSYLRKNIAYMTPGC